MQNRSSSVLLSVLRCVAALTVFVTAPHFASAAPYNAPKDGYSINLPGQPKVGSRPMAIPGGATLNVNFVAVSNPPVAYIVIPMTLPSAPKGAAIEGFLGGVQTGFTSSTRAKLLSSKKVSLGSVPGREIVVQVQKSLMRARFFVKGNRSYQVIAVSPQANGAKYVAQITQVLNSFRITR